MKRITTNISILKESQFFEIPQIIRIQVEFVDSKDVSFLFPDIESGGKNIYVATIAPDQQDPSAQKIQKDFGHIDGKALHVGAAVKNLITSIQMNGYESGLRIPTDRIELVRK